MEVIVQWLIVLLTDTWSCDLIHVLSCDPPIHTAPSVPTNLTVIALSHSRVMVTWGNVIDDGGAVVEVYRLVVTVTRTGLSSPTAPEFPPGINGHMLTGLVNNTNYTWVCLLLFTVFNWWYALFRIQVSARNSQGFGPNATDTVVTLDIGKVTVVLVIWGINTIVDQFAPHNKYKYP